MSSEIDYESLDVDKAVINKDRKFRIISKVTKSFFPRDLVFYDIETDPTLTAKNVRTHYFKMGFMTHCVLDKTGHAIKKTEYVQHKEHQVFDDLMNILKGRNKILVLAHNQNYDFVASNMLFYFTNNGWEIQLFNPESKAFLVKFTKGRKTVFFIDTLNFFAGSAESIGKELKLPKLKMPRIIKRFENELKENNYDLEKISTACYNYYNKWLIYNQRDVEIIEKATLNLIQFISDNDYGSFAYTIAGLSYSIFKHNFLNARLKVHTDIPALTLERASYFGGRTEIFYQGLMEAMNYYILDVTSMYPFVMQSFKFPISCIGRVTRPDIDTLKRKTDEYGVIANVDIKTDINCLPKRHNGKLTFPIGRFNTTLAQPELKLALDLGIVENVNTAYLYHMDYIFRDYVKEFFAMKSKNKKDGNTIYAYFYKILLNSLYGKFAQRITNYVPTGEKSQLQFATGIYSDEINHEKYFTKTINHDVFKVEKRIEANFSMPSVSSFVTSYARVHLWHMMSRAGHKNYFYCDTDSLFVNQKGYNNLKPFIRDNELGYLELEKKSKDVTIRTVKDYTFGKKVKRKGVPSRWKEIEYNVFSGEKFSRVNDIFVNDDFFKMQTKTTTKTLSGLYDKGVIHKSGIVTPLILVNKRI